LAIEGGVHSPGALRAGAAKAISALLYAALAYLFVGPAALSAMGVTEPPWAVAARENKIALFAGYFVLNGVAAKLQSTGAYEVALNGKLLWSKISEGGVPPLEVIARAVAAETGWSANPQVAAQLGFGDPSSW
jgi:selT/selW/selH-like putative selenoprotein